MKNNIREIKEISEEFSYQLSEMFDNIGLGEIAREVEKVDFLNYGNQDKLLELLRDDKIVRL